MGDYLLRYICEYGTRMHTQIFIHKGTHQIMYIKSGRVRLNLWNVPCQYNVGLVVEPYISYVCRTFLLAILVLSNS